MDADHRHELKQNDLEEFLTHSKEFWAKWGNFITIVVLVVVVSVTGYRFYQSRQVSAQEKALADLLSAATPEAYRDLARESDNPVVRTMANLRGADMILLQLSMPEPPNDGPGQGSDGKPATDQKPDATPMDPAEREKRLSQAASMYRQVIEQSPHVLYAFNARLGLAAVAESLGQWDDAAAEYQRVATDAAATYPAIAGQAATRLELLDRLKMPLTFAPEPPPPADKPQTNAGTEAMPQVTAPVETSQTTPESAPVAVDPPAETPAP